MIRQLFIWVFVIFVGMGASGLEAADIYQWIDKDGVQHFTDGPPPPGAEIVEGLSETPPDTPPTNKGAGNTENRPAVENDGPNPEYIEAAGGVENDSTTPDTREEYWRRRGWDNGSAAGQDTGAQEGGDTGPAGPQDPGTDEGGENAPRTDGESP